MRKKRQRPQGREPFPGAGYPLDFENIKSDDFDIVEKRLEEIGSMEERISHLLTLGEHFEYEAGHNADLLFPLVKAPNDALRPDLAERVAHVRVFRDRLKRKLEQLRNLLEIEKQQSGKASQSEPCAEEIEDEPEPGQWDGLRVAVALCALLRAAKLPDGISDRAVGRFAHKLTGRSAKRMAEMFHNARAASFSDDVANDVADALKDIGLVWLVTDVRKKFQKPEI